MKNFRDMDYALNKYSKGIVYKFVDGITETTLEDYLYENPHNTKEDFVKLKKLSDEIYYEQDKHQNRISRLDINFQYVKQIENKNTFISFLVIDTEESESKKEKALAAARELIKSGKLTEIQKRRFLLYFYKGLSTRQIARQEGVHQRAVWDSLRWSRKKLREFFRETFPYAEFTIRQSKIAKDGQ